jgi:hypothetical protein
LQSLVGPSLGPAASRVVVSSVAAVFGLGRVDLLVRRLDVASSTRRLDLVDDLVVVLVVRRDRGRGRAPPPGGLRARPCAGSPAPGGDGWRAAPACRRLALAPAVELSSS